MREDVWQSLARRLVMSVEAPDYDTRVTGSAPHLPLVLVMFGLAIPALASLFSIWWIDALYGWLIFGLLWIIFTSILASHYFTNVRRITGPNPAWDSQEARVVRAPAIAGDDKIAPRAREQPPAPTDWSEGADSVSVTGLHRPASVIPLGASRTISLGMNLFVGALFIGETVFFQALDHGSFLSHSWPLGAPGAFIIAVTLVAILSRLWARRPFSVVVDAQGLRWRHGSRQRFIPWSAAQALCMMDLPSSIRQPPALWRIYWIQGPDGALTWANSGRWRAPRGWYALPDVGAPPADDPAGRLCALAAKGSGLPLRDLTESATRFLQNWTPMVLLRGLPALATDLPLAEEERRRFTTRRAARLRGAWMGFGFGVALNLLMLVAVVALLVAVPRAYGDQLRQAERSTPIFSDSLATQSGQWPNASAPDAPFVYLGGVYTISASPDAQGCCDLMSLAKPSFDGGVVEVTVRQVGDDYDQAGLVIRADPTTQQALVFAITAGGGWRLERFTLNGSENQGTEGDELIYAGLFIPTGAIHRGADTTNRLAAIIHGASYAFFVNGQYIGSYHDDHIVGQRVGVYADGLGQTTAFSDFVVYPAPLPFIASIADNYSARSLWPSR